MSKDRYQLDQSSELARVAIARSLEARRTEVVEATCAYVQGAVPEVRVSGNGDYRPGLLRTAVAVLDYVLQGLRHELDRVEPVPHAALQQVRRAARTGTSVTVVVQCCFACHHWLEECAREEAKRIGISEDESAMSDLRRIQKALRERLLNAAEREHARARDELVPAAEHLEATVLWQMGKDDTGPILGATFEEIRDGIARALRDREAEITATILRHLRRSVPDEIAKDNVEYATGLQEAVAAVVDYCITAIEHDEEWIGPLPRAALEQAQRAARNGVGLGTVLRRCASGERALRQIVIQEARHLPSETVARILGPQESALGTLVASLEQEYADASAKGHSPSVRLQLAAVQRLLASDWVDGGDLVALSYEIHARSHIGLVAEGPGAEAALRRIGEICSHGSLVIPLGDHTAWAWLAQQDALSVEGIESVMLQDGESAPSVGVGGLHSGVDGFVRTHQEAREALRLALRRPQKLATYAEAPLLAAALQNSSLRRWLKDLVTPLSQAQRDALRAYIATGCVASSAAATIGVSRHTIEKRISDAECRIKRQLQTCLADIHVALSLVEIEEGAIGGKSED